MKLDSGLVAGTNFWMAQKRSAMPMTESMRVSHETIYRSLFIQSPRSAEEEYKWGICDPKRRIRRSRHSHL